LGYHLKADKLGGPEGDRYGDVCGISTASHDNTADAGMVMARIDTVPTAIEKDFSQAAEIHRIGINRNADVAEIAGAIPGGNVHASAERDGEMREVAAHANAFVHGVARAAGGPRIRITEPDLRVHEIANCLHTLAAPGHHSKIRPSETGKIVAIAIPAESRYGPARDRGQSFARMPYQW
jgi:hypothetical protein